MRLTKAHKVYILRGFATYCEYDEIAANVAARFDPPNAYKEWDFEMLKLEIHILHDMLSDLPQDLKELFLKERVEYRKSINDLPISSLKWRLQERTHLFRKATEVEDYKLANEILGDAAIDMASAELEGIREAVSMGKTIEAHDKFGRKAVNE